MARPRGFERESALEAAMQVFWAQGYKATSIQELLQAMGVNRGSLYDTFGDKQSLFLETLDHYRTSILNEQTQMLRNPGAGRKEVEQFFLSLVERCGSTDALRGCYIANSLVELGPHCPGTAKKVDQCLRELEAAFTNALRNAQVNGEISDRHSVQALARMCVSQTLASMVLLKIAVSCDFLEEAIRTCLASFD